MGLGDARDVAIRVDHIHDAPVGEKRHRQPRDPLHRARIVHEHGHLGTRVGQKAEHALGLLAVGDLVRYFGRSDHLPFVVADRRNPARHLDALAVLSHPHGINVLSFFTSMNLCHRVGNLLAQLGRHDELDRSTDRLFGGIAKKVFGGLVPVRDDPVDVFADDRVMGTLDDRGQAISCLRGTARLAGVAKHEHRSEQLAAIVSDRRRAVVDRALGAVLGDQHRMIGQTDDDSFAKDLVAGVLDR